MKVAFHLFLVFLFFSLRCNGQLTIIPSWNTNPLELQRVYLTKNNDSISFSALKMYLSDFRFIEKNNGNTINIDTLIFYDLADSSTHTFFNDLNLKNFESLAFTLGLDSTKNVSGELENIGHFIQFILIGANKMQNTIHLTFRKFIFKRQEKLCAKFF